MAAYYVGLSANTFLSRVRDGIYPQGKRDGNRVLWDRLELDRRLDGGAANEPSSAESDVAREEAKALAALG